MFFSGNSHGTHLSSQQFIIALALFQEKDDKNVKCILILMEDQHLTLHELQTCTNLQVLILLWQVLNDYP